MISFENEAQKKYCTIPHSANPSYHKRATVMSKYQCDIAFVGGKLNLKSWFNNNILPEVAKKYDLKIFGPGWTKSDIILRGMSKTFREIGMDRLSPLFDKFRSQVPDHEIGSLYNSAKILLNFHEREDDGSQPHHVVSQRTFHIAASGGFQISDPVIALNRYFPDQFITANLDKNDWLDKIDFYLRNENERKKITNYTYQYANANHLVTHRVKFFLDKLSYC
jgi:Glycosyl transferases group 1